MGNIPTSTKILLSIAIALVGGLTLLTFTNIGQNTQAILGGGATSGDATVIVDATYTGRKLTQAEKDQMTFSVYTNTGALGSAEYVLRDQPLGQYSIPAGTYYFSLNISKVRNQLKIDGNPHTPAEHPENVTLTAGNRKDVTLNITLLPYQNGGDYPIGSDTNLPAVRDDIATIEFKKIITDISNTIPYTTNRKGSTTILTLNGTPYLFDRVYQQLFVYNLTKPYDPALAASTSLAAPNGCKAPSDFGVIEQGNKAVGYVEGSWCIAFFEFDATSETFTFVNKRETPHDKYAATGLSTDIDLLFKAGNGDLYAAAYLFHPDQEEIAQAIGHSGIYKYETLINTTEYIGPDATVDYLVGDVRVDGSNWAASCSVAGVVPKKFIHPVALEVYYDESSNPFLIYNIEEVSEKYHNTNPNWKMIVDFSQILNPKRGATAADDIMFTKQDCGGSKVYDTGCDRTLHERKNSFLNTYYRGDPIVDNATGNLWYAYYLPQTTTTSSQNVCLTVNPTTGQVRTRVQFGVLDLTDPFKIDRLAFPIVGSALFDTHGGHNSGTVEYSGITNALNGAIGGGAYAQQGHHTIKNNIVVFDTFTERDFDCLKNNGDMQSCAMSQHPTKVQFGFFDEKNALLAWIDDTTGETVSWEKNIKKKPVATTHFSMLDADILQIGPKQFAVYANNGFSTVVYRIQFNELPENIDLSKGAIGGGGNTGGGGIDLPCSNFTYNCGNCTNIDGKMQCANCTFECAE